MESELAHLEVLGPRLGLDAWLGTLQEAGTCHLADALRGIEGEPGIGRPGPREEERRAADVRAPALLALRGLVPVLPAPGPGTGERAAWSLAPGGVDEEVLVGRAERARGLAVRLRADLEAARAIEREVDDHEGVRAALDALVAAGRTSVAGEAWAFPSGVERRLRAVAREAGGALGSNGGKGALVLPTSAAADLAAALARSGGVRVGFPPALAGRPPAEAVRLFEPLAREALERERRADADLAARLRADGPEARRLLDQLEDAEARDGAQRLLAATRHVVAARVWVAREHVGDLVARLEREHGEGVAVRSLAPADDAPAPLRELPAAPLDVGRGLAPGRFSRRTAVGLLALTGPLAYALTTGGLVVGLALLFGGGLLALATSPGSPRRQAGYLAQVCGLLALLVSVGRLLLHGPGERDLGVGSGWFDGLWFAVFGADGNARHVATVLGAVALLLAGYGALAAFVSAARRELAARRSAARATVGLTFVGALLVSFGVGPTLGLTVLAVLALAVHLATWRGASEPSLVADVVPILRVFALAAVASEATQWAIVLLSEGAGRAVLGALVLLVALAALVLDAVQVAMGLADEPALGGTPPGPVFTPFVARRRASGTEGA